MRISGEKLAAEAEATGFQANMLEKAAHLLGLLDAIRSHPFLRGKLALKGGTALNLFVFDLPRLSIDIDLNYVGAESREAMLEERPKVEDAIQAVFSREDLDIRHGPKEYAGGKWSLRYPGASGRTGRIDVDINYMYRVPLWPIVTMDSRSLGSWRATGIPVVDIHELAAGKLTAAECCASPAFPGRPAGSSCRSAGSRPSPAAPYTGAGRSPSAPARSATGSSLISLHPHGPAYGIQHILVVDRVRRAGLDLNKVRRHT